MELQTQLVLARRFGYLAAEEYEEVERRASEVGRMLSAMVTSLRSAPNS
jgi:four helix bundle protein